MRVTVGNQAVLMAIVLIASTAVLCASFADADPTEPDIKVIVPSEDLTPEDPIDFILGYEAISAELRMSEGEVFILIDPEIVADSLYRIVREAIGTERFIGESEFHRFVGFSTVTITEQDEDFDGVHIDTEFLSIVTMTLDLDHRWGSISDCIHGFAEYQNSFLSRMAASTFFQESRATDVCVDRKQSDESDDPDGFHFEESDVESDCLLPIVHPEPVSKRVPVFCEGDSSAVMPVIARGTVI